jgi:phosphoribosylformylglycinamidine cyclo-ligase
VRYNFNSLPSPTGIFKQIQVDGDIDSKEMYRTFNMGVGFCVIVSKPSINDVIRVFEKYKMCCKPVGKIEKGSGEVTIRIDDKSQTL